MDTLFCLKIRDKAMGKGLYYITNRNYQTSFDHLDFYEVNIEAIRRVNFDSFDYYNSAAVLKLVEKPEIFLADLQCNMRSENRDTLFFIHGYHTGREDALEMGLEIFDRYGDFNVVIFDWSSADTLTGYWRDRKLAKPSGAVLARMINQYIKFITTASIKNCNQKIHLVAHSMGNYVLCNALKSYKENYSSNIFEVIENSFLMAADVDWVAFEKDSTDNLSLLSEISNKIIVYYNEYDAALAISETTKHTLIKRLGRDGIKNITTVSDDISQVKFNTMDENISGNGFHSYLTKSKVVIDDLNAWIKKIENKKRKLDHKMNSWVLCP